MNLALAVRTPEFEPQYTIAVDFADRSIEGAVTAYRDGKMGQQAFDRVIEGVLSHNPEHLEAHLTSGAAAYARGDYDNALASYRRAETVAVGVLQDWMLTEADYSTGVGKMLVRALMGVGLASMRLGNYEDSIAAIESMLAKTPADQQSARNLLGSLYLRAGDNAMAERYLGMCAEKYPAAGYELALLFFKEKKLLEATTQLRRAILKNGYIGEAMSGNRKPQQRIFWHTSDLEKPTHAMTYVSNFMDAWDGTKHAREFASWVYNHPKVMKERAEVLDLQEQMLHESVGTRAWSEISRQWAMLVQGVNDDISRQILVVRTDLDGNSIFPWQVRS